jgi:hypothetical protein
LGAISFEKAFNSYLKRTNIAYKMIKNKPYLKTCKIILVFATSKKFIRLQKLFIILPAGLCCSFSWGVNNQKTAVFTFEPAEGRQQFVSFLPAGPEAGRFAIYNLFRRNVLLRYVRTNKQKEYLFILWKRKYENIV